MTDDGSVPPTPDTAPMPPPPAAPPAPTSAPEADPAAAPDMPETPVSSPLSTTPLPAEPVVSQEAIQEISAELTEAVKEAVLGVPEKAPDAPSSSAPPPQQSAPAATTSSTPVSNAPTTDIKSLRGKALNAHRAQMHARIERIFELKVLGRPIKNDDVEKHLDVSDKSAANYLKELVRQGRMEKIGEFKQTKYRFLS